MDTVALLVVLGPLLLVFLWSSKSIGDHGSSSGMPVGGDSSSSASGDTDTGWFGSGDPGGFGCGDGGSSWSSSDSGPC